MNKNIAVIDLGTNTCNLMVAEFNQPYYQVVYHGKEAVKLGKNGIDKNLLTTDGLERAIQAIQKHQEIVRGYSVSETLVIATSAIREATNQEWFQHEIKASTGLELCIISGEKEAELIFKGVKLALGEMEDHTLILDIGGGSNEFILIEDGEPVWKQSFPLGMARVVEQMSPSDPITSEEIQRIKQWFQDGLNPLWDRLKNRPVTTLIGCSGAFDTVADLIDQTVAGSKARIRQEITIRDFNLTYNKLISSTSEERMGMKGMEPIRVEMIVPAIIFIQLIIEKLNIQNILQTDYALMEGILYEKLFALNKI